jgi:hypothetical protein
MGRKALAAITKSVLDLALREQIFYYEFDGIKKGIDKNNR